jgi:3-oxoacyl-[acyl-carrier-protein] synthase-3
MSVRANDRENVDAQAVLRKLLIVWGDFESRLSQVPIVARLLRGELRMDDYRALLLDHRQQVIEGSRWIARAASSIDRQWSEQRSLILRHAVTEHRDYEMLEADYRAVGGDAEAMRNALPNLGTEGLSAWMMWRASQPNPFDLAGAMFLIEGLGKRFAKDFAARLQRDLGLADDQIRFYRYHAEHDAGHLEELEALLGSGILAIDGLDRQIVRTARVTARLYLLQLEELGNV